MKYYLIKAVIAIIAVFLSGVTWLGLVLILKKSGISALQTVAVYISQFSFLGWLLLGLLSIIYYFVITKYLPMH
jgi:hypothetical protein